jgi:uncharacterized membrane protein
MEMNQPYLTNDAVILGLLMLMLGFVFWTAESQQPFWKSFYKWVPALFICYFLPSVLRATGLVDPAQSKLPSMASGYLLPASLVLLTLSVDLKEVVKLGPKALIMFLTGTVGIAIGGPVTIIIFKMIYPDMVDADLWRGMATLAGSWIGGAANQAAMKEVFGVGDALFSKMVAVDIMAANVWLGVLIAGVGMRRAINAFLRADSSSIEALKDKMDEYQRRNSKIPTLGDTMKILMIAFGCTGLAHFLSDLIVPFLVANYPGLAKYSLHSSFFWLVVLATTFGVALSFTKMRKLEGAGASRIGRVFIYMLVATIGLKMDILAIFSSPGLFFIGITWLSIHVILMILIAYLIKAPYFFVAVGSTANVGGAASAPAIASEFHPSLAPVGVLLAVLGYVLGTYVAWLCGIWMGFISG